MGVTTRPSFRFGPYRVDLDERCLFRDETPVPLPPKVFEVLLVLVENAGHVVQKKALIERVWPDTFVEEANLTVHVSALRKLLGDGFIETIPRRGYRFVAPVVSGAPADASPIVARRALPSHGPAVYAWTGIALIGVVTVVTVLALGAPAPHTVSLAIAPFDNPTRDDAAGPLVDDVARTVAVRLSTISPRIELRAMSSSGAHSGEGHWADPAALGRSLHVDAVLAGRVVNKQQYWMIQAQLVNVRDGAVLWTADYPGQSLTSIYAVEDEMVAQVARHLPVSLSPEELKLLERHRPKVDEAQRLSDRADALFFQATPASLRKSIEYAKQAIALDPTYGMPYGQIASAYSLMGDTDVLPPDVARQHVHEWQQKARQVDDGVYTSHITALGPLERGWDWSGPRRAGNLHPFYRDFLIANGRLDEAIAIETESAQDHPNFLSDYGLGKTNYFARRYDRAVEFFRKTLELDPGFVPAHFGLGRAYVQQRRYAEAIAEFRAAAEFPRASGALGHALAVSAQRDAARRLLADLTARARHDYVTPINFAWIQVGLGQKDQAFAWLKRACDTQVPETSHLKVDPVYDSLRGDPRYRELVRCVGLDE
jgi:DNA-binding winged helix-turn-helix (wHTH) protein/TolB-like protein/Tfp pilus assembly protein PilF